MPKVLSYTPSWLSRSSPGFELFTASKPKDSGRQQHGHLHKTPAAAATQRLIARRGTEIFTVVGNEIRWSDLVMLKENSGNGSQYRVLRVPVGGQITQLVVSPQDDYMAVVTSHTVYVAVIPDSTHLMANDSGPLKMKAFQLGPTAHVLEHSPIASVLWHPLGLEGRCLVTVTADATVRLWEVHRDDRSSFNEPTLAIDLQKLVNATSSDEDFRASKYGSNKGFSPDAIELEIAAACFGAGRESSDRSGWAPMTLWAATREGDVYALSPLLPGKWQCKANRPYTSFLKALGASVAANATLVRSDPGATPEQRLTVKQQLLWLAEVNDQLVVSISDSTTLETYDTYSRPGSVPAVPKLQGPFIVHPEIDDDLEIRDLLVFGLQGHNDLDDAEFAANEQALSPASIVCLLTNNCDVHICLDLDGVEGKWLPSGKGKPMSTVEDEQHLLLVFESVQLGPQVDQVVDLHPTFTVDVQPGPSFFVTHDFGVHFLSLASWAQNLEAELQSQNAEGSNFRLDLSMESSSTLVEEILHFSPPKKTAAPLTSASIVLDDSDTGYFLLTTLNGLPCAALFDRPQAAYFGSSRLAAEERQDAKYGDLPLLEPRVAYQAPDALWTESQLLRWYERSIPSHHRRAAREEIKLSPANLDVLTGAHRVIAQETHELQTAVADVFLRCERLQREFADQLRKVSQLRERVDNVTGDNDAELAGEAGSQRSGDDDDAAAAAASGSQRILRRVERARARQQELAERQARLAKKLSRAKGGKLSDSERAWAREVDELDRSVARAKGPADSEDGGDEDEDESESMPAWLRLEELKRLKGELAGEAKKVAAAADEAAAGGTGSEAASPKVPSEARRQRVSKVMDLLERETALVDATTEKLSRMGLIQGY